MEDKTKKSKINYVFIILVSLLLIFSIFQSFQINELKQQFVNYDLSLSGNSVQSNAVRQSAPQTTMVGGC